MNQKFYNSKLGWGLALIYLALSVFAIIDYRQCVGGWINLCGLSLVIATSPSQITIGELLSWLGVPPVNYLEPQLPDVLQIGLHFFLCTVFAYFLGFYVEKLIRRIFLWRSH